MMTPEEIQQVVEDYKKSSQSLNEFLKKDKEGNIKINLGKLRNLGRDPRDKVNGGGDKGKEEKENKLETKKKEDKNDNVNLPNNDGKIDDKTKVKPITDGGKTNDKTEIKPITDGGKTTDKPKLKVSGTGPVVDNPDTPNKDERAEYGKTLNKIKTDKDNKSAVESGKDERMDAPTASVKTQVDAYKKGVASPATFKTNQRQTRELVKQQSKEIYPTISKDDLNKYSRSKKYTADDGKTQVDRSTVNTIAKFDMGPNIKKGDKLGVISGNMRKKYDMKAASFKPEAYDLVLDYVLSEGHADSLDEAHYVMMQMDANTIQQIIEMSSPYTISQADINAKTPAFKNYQKGVKNKITGEPLYKLGSGVNLPKI